MRQYGIQTSFHQIQYLHQHEFYLLTFLEVLSLTLIDRSKILAKVCSNESVESDWGSKETKATSLDLFQPKQSPPLWR